jgi:Icc-related predicted phosphoesterase
MEGADRRPSLARRAVPVVAVVVVAAAAAVLTLGMVSRVRGEVGPGTVAMRGRWHLGGHTEIELPPLGAVQASSHRAPVALEAQVVQLDVEQVQRLMAAESVTDALRKDVEDDIVDLARRFAVRSVAIAAVVGAVAAAVLPHRRRWWHLLVGAFAGALAVGSLLGAAWRDYDAEAFLEPTFEGPLEHAPEVVTAVRRHVDGFGDLRDRVETLGDQVRNLYATATEGPAPPSAREVRIVHVSDIHSNPLGMEITRQLAAQFDADAVIDTGDITSFGLPMEARIAELVGDIGVPYLFVPGNHDSDGNRASLATAANVRLLDGEAVDVRGVRILGIGDPTFTADNGMSTQEANEVKQAHARVVAALARRAGADVVAVHDVRSAARVAGLTPLVLAGHTHQRSVDTVGDTTFLTVGSTGATGLGSFTVETAAPYEAQVLRFHGGRLVAYDYVTLRGIGGSFTIERRLVDDPDALALPAPESPAG